MSTNTFYVVQCFIFTHIALNHFYDLNTFPQMYTGGKLLFADHIFNGYGNAKKDFLKQVSWIGYRVYHTLSPGSSVV